MYYFVSSIVSCSPMLFVRATILSRAKLLWVTLTERWTRVSQASLAQCYGNATGVEIYNRSHRWMWEKFNRQNCFFIPSRACGDFLRLWRAAARKGNRQKGSIKLDEQVIDEADKTEWMWLHVKLATRPPNWKVWDSKSWELRDLPTNSEIPNNRVLSA